MSRSEFFERELYNYLFAILRPVVYATLGVKELADRRRQRGVRRFAEKNFSHRPTQKHTDKRGSRFAGKILGHPDEIKRTKISSRLNRRVVPKSSPQRNKCNKDFRG